MCCSLRLGFIAALLSLGGTLASSQDNTTAQVRKAIDAGNQQYCAAYEKSDPRAFAAVYDEEGTRLEATGEIVRGRAAIASEVEAQWKQIATIPHRVSADTENVWVVDDFAYEFGKFTFKLTPAGEKEQDFSGHYLTVWKKQKDGGWRIFRDMNVTGKK
jgi:uncharacterized protein (TIGR02246 family)